MLLKWAFINIPAAFYNDNGLQSFQYVHSSIWMKQIRDEHHWTQEK